VRLVALLAGAGVAATQLGKGGTRVISGARFIQTRNFRHGCAVLKRARAAVVTEGGLHHAAAAVGTPAVVIYGGYISPAQTGYDGQVALFTGGEPCGMRLPCGHCADAMARITPEEVFERVMRTLGATK
jgi:ADP-heptose:LPS heptosyltransferase